MALFMPLAAQQLRSTSHAALVRWRKLRHEYEDEVAMRCNNNTDKIVKKSFDKRLLGVWCDFDWDVPDEFILTKIYKIITSVKNNSVSDIAASFKENVTIDMTEKEQGWQEFFTGNEGSRLKCKLLMESLQPRSLRDEVTTTVKY
ncbi:LOW QUALITY PROTEIN: hypothetical protein PHMEG_00013548 [Phytophthora megakarya]|uniref:Uncharacterized protein n=1 Tax=Phytophthora megakarya TaxID=4795 RepID=A0A225W848_9STRA|nr:LOW QUALITY PROTEIN: hypothetical protein PHMEG_00013548 [Phytophthora megakarya]